MTGNIEKLTERYIIYGVGRVGRSSAKELIVMGEAAKMVKLEAIASGATQ